MTSTTYHKSDPSLVASDTERATTMWIFALSIEILAQNHSIFRGAEISPQRNFILVFLYNFFFQKHEKRRPGGTGYSGKSGV